MDLLLHMKRSRRNRKGIWRCRHSFFRAEDLGRIQEALEDGYGYDAPGSFTAWLSTKTAMHAWKMPGVRYDIGDLESYRKVNERMG